MADQLNGIGTYAKDLKTLTGRQAYFLDVLGTENAKDLSVVSFKAVEHMGGSYRITIDLTHPDSLARSDYLGRDATFRMVPGDGSEPRVFSGCITRFSKIKTTKDFCSYRIVVEAHIARLKITRTSRIFQHQTAPQIIESILRRHGLKGHQFAFKLRRPYPQHKFRFQYQTSDWNYIHILMQQEGIYSYIVPGKHGDIVVFADDVDHYLYEPQLKVLYREMSGMASDVGSVSALQMHAQTVPQSYAVADYNPDQAWERFRAEANVARKDTTTYGQPYIYGTHHLDQDGAKWEAQLRHEAAIAWQIVYEGESNVPDLRPARVMQMDEALPDAPNGQLVIEVIHAGARDEPYRNTYQAIPADRRFRLKIEDRKWPRISGTLSARVTSPDKYKYAYLTQQGCYTVRFDCDFDEWNPGGESVPLRLAKPFAGGLQTGFHFPALDGTEAVLEFRDADPNKPYIAAFHHNSQQVDLVTSQDRWLSRNVIHTQGDNKVELEDWAGEEHVKISTPHSGKTQLTLGHIVDGKRKKRGEGFELRTSAYGAIRGGKGLFFSADDQPNAAGQQLDMQAAKDQLAEALQMMQGLAQAAQAAQAHANEVETQRQLLAQRLDRLQRAVILASAPAGIALTSGDQLQLSAKANLTATAGSNVDVGAGRNITLSAANAASIFGQNDGVKVIAAKSDIQTVAEAGQILTTSAKDMKFTSVNGELHASARESLVLSCGGAYVRLSGGNVEIGCPGYIILKRAGLNMEGPASLHESYPPLSNAGPNTRKFALHYDGHPDDRLSGYRYRLHKENGSVVEGVTNDNGETSMAHSEMAELVRIEILGKADA